MKKILVLLAASMALVLACGKDNKEDKTTSLSAVTGEVSDVKEYSAVLYAFYNLAEGDEASSFGFVVSESNSAIKSLEDGDVYTAEDADHYRRYNCKVGGLFPGNTYYYAAFVQTKGGDLKVGETRKFFTQALPEIHEVDLGLSVLWADCNIGAKSPSAAGSYFAWGYLATSYSYEWSSYDRYSKGSPNSLLKYNDNSELGFRDNKVTLEHDDDAASVLLRGNWRMPDRTDFLELFEKTEAQWTTQDGVSGFKFTATNGNSIFLPVTGYKFGTKLDGETVKGEYWTRSLYVPNPINAWAFTFDTMTKPAELEELDNVLRVYGLVIRPVKDK